MSAEKTNNGAAAGRIPVTEEKRLLRSRMKALRAAAPDRAERDKRIFENLFAYPAFAGAQSVFIYCSLAEEADTRRIIGELLARGKRVYLPRTEGKEMIAVRYEGGGLCPGKFGVSEPEGEESEDKPEVCILPLLAAHMEPGGTVLCESELAADLPDEAAGLEKIKQYRYGTVLVSRYQKRRADL